MMDPTIRKAIETEMQYLSDDKEICNYRLYKKCLKDWNSSIMAARSGKSRSSG